MNRYVSELIRHVENDQSRWDRVDTYADSADHNGKVISSLLETRLVEFNYTVVLEQISHVLGPDWVLQSPPHPPSQQLQQRTQQQQQTNRWIYMFKPTHNDDVNESNCSAESPRIEVDFYFLKPSAADSVTSGSVMGDRANDVAVATGGTSSDTRKVRDYQHSRTHSSLTQAQEEEVLVKTVELSQGEVNSKDLSGLSQPSLSRATNLEQTHHINSSTFNFTHFPPTHSPNRENSSSSLLKRISNLSLLVPQVLRYIGSEKLYIISHGNYIRAVALPGLNAQAFSSNCAIVHTSYTLSNTLNHRTESVRERAINPLLTEKNNSCMTTNRASTCSAILNDISIDVKSTSTGVSAHVSSLTSTCTVAACSEPLVPRVEPVPVLSPLLRPCLEDAKVLFPGVKRNINRDVDNTTCPHISQAKQREGGDRNALLGLYGHDPSTEGQGSDVSVTCSSPVPMVPCPWKRCFEAEGSETVTMMRDQLEKECRLYDNVPYVYT